MDIDQKKPPSQENIGCVDTNPGAGSTDVLSKNCMDETGSALHRGQMVCGGNACPNAARLWDEVRWFGSLVGMVDILKHY